jgi:hypothetical protein
MIYFVKIDQLRYLIILMLIGMPSSLKQLLFLCSKVNFLLSTFILLMTFIIMYLPSQLCQISIDSDQISDKLKHDISSISSC